jgi:zinc transport system permease protein
MSIESFMLRALLAALFLAPLCALLGVFVTARKMAFFSDTIAHAALMGVAIGLWLGMVEPTIPMVLFSLMVAMGMIWLKQNTDLLSDTIMALLLSGSVAAGLIIFNLQNATPGIIHSFLFGDILAVSNFDVWLAGCLWLVVGAGVFWKLSALTLLTAQEEVAHVCGVRVKALNYVFVVVLTLAVATSIRLLGIILVTSLLVIPAATARNLSCNLRQHILLSVLVGLIGGLGGIALSYRYDVASGPTIVLTCIAMFVVSLLVRQWRPGRKAALNP